ncbi:MAG: hypothetical protein KY467_10090 [Gemmatimonadetes bacterium]|nr:hypothetical protein [Gemmatimonadota bacterium]
MTGEAAAALSADGTFPYAGPTHQREDPIISPERAGEQALGYVRAFGQFFHRSWEKEAGRRIDLRGLRVHPRVFYAESPYGRFPDGPIAPGYRKGFGPYYLVTLTDGRSPVLLVGVSAFNTDVYVNERGLVMTPQDGGNEFVSWGVPVDTAEYVVMTPERAVARLGLRTGARVTTPPHLVQMSVFHHPVLAAWRLTLDRPIRVRAAGGGWQRETRDVYLNGRGHYMVPADEQPLGHTERFLTTSWSSQNRETIEATVPIIRGSAVEWVTVTPDSISVVEREG